MHFLCRDHSYDLSRRALLFGIVNVTPDSFSDGGSFLEVKKAVTHGLQLLEEGATILDIGGESTRPGSLPVDANEEIARIIPVIQALRQKTDAPLSIDTTKAVVAEAALKAGASIINDISSLSDPLMAPLVAHFKAGLILMHKQGDPLTMQEHPHYPDNNVVGAVMTFLRKAQKKAEASGVATNSLALDPGLGFGKTKDHNFALLNAIPQLLQLKRPLLIGHSRKSFLALDEAPASKRLIPSVAVTTLARYHGATLFRVHDPRPHQEALSITETLLSCS